MINPQSTAKIAGHPLHPMLIPFPVAFFVAAGVCDLALLKTDHIFWFTATQWLLGGGLFIAILAAIAGVIDFLGDRRIRNLKAVWWHAGGNIIIVLIETYNFYIRYNTGVESVSYIGFSLSWICIALLLFTGWKGWEMVYRHRVGVQDTSL